MQIGQSTHKTMLCLVQYPQITRYNIRTSAYPQIRILPPACYVCVVASVVVASNDRHCVNYHRVGVRLTVLHRPPQRSVA